MKITVEVKAVPEIDSPEHAAKRNKYAPGFAEAVRKTIADAKKIDPKSKWGWCTVDLIVTVVSGDFRAVGTASLGECSYTSALGFALTSGYFDDMHREALAGAMKQLRAAGRMAAV